MISRIFDMVNVNSPQVLLLVEYDSHSPDVGSANTHGYVPHLKLYPVLDLPGFEVQLDSVIGFDVWMGEANSSPIVSDDIRNLVGSHEPLFDLAQLVFALLIVDLV